MDIWVSGKAYEAAISGSQVPQDESWPEPTRYKWGRGERYRYEGTLELAEWIASHFEDVGEGFVLGSDDPESKAEGRELLVNARRIRTAMKKCVG